MHSMRSETIGARRTIFTIAIPIMISNVSTPLLGLVDTGTDDLYVRVLDF